MQGITKPEQRTKFEAIMCNVDALISKEAEITDKIKEMERKK